MAGVKRALQKPPKQKPPHIGQLIQAEMEARGLSVKALSALSDLPTRDLLGLFSGELLRLSVARGLGRGLGLSMPFLLQLDAECRRPNRDDRSAALLIQREPVRQGTSRD
jgi:plasmid maintenance system antidote protein VapI